MPDELTAAKKPVAVLGYDFERVIDEDSTLDETLSVIRSAVA